MTRTTTRGAPGTASPPARKRVVAPLLGGAEAHRLLNALGWEPVTEGTARSALQLAGASRSLRQSAVARIGHGRLHLRATGEPPGEPRARLIAVVSGTAEVRTRPGLPVTRLDRGRMLILVGEDAEMEVENEFVRYEYAAPARTMMRAVGRSLREGEAFAVPRHAAQPFLALASAVLEAPADGYSWRAVDELHAAMSHAVAVVLGHAAGRRGQTLSAPEAGLVAEAEAVIAARAGDRSFGVQQLAQELGVSRAWLHRVFAKLGTTPSARLRGPH